MITGYCKSCGQPCEGHTENIGIGWYEYLGHKGHDGRKGVFSNCCGDEMCMDGELRIPYDSNEQWRGGE